jgi:hypothetical protein
MKKMAKQIKLIAWNGHSAFYNFRGIYQYKKVNDMMIKSEQYNSFIY